MNPNHYNDIIVTCKLYYETDHVVTKDRVIQEIVNFDKSIQNYIKNAKNVTLITTYIPASQTYKHFLELTFCGKHATLIQLGKPDCFFLSEQEFLIPKY